MVYFSYVDSSRMVSVVMGTGSDLKSQMQKKGMKVITNKVLRIYELFMVNQFNHLTKCVVKLYYILVKRPDARRA